MDRRDRQRSVPRDAGAPERRRSWGGTYFVPYLGLAARDVGTAEPGPAHPVSRGAVVTETVPGQRASLAGLEPGDVILAVEGRPVGNVPHLFRLIERGIRHRPMVVSVLRGPTLISAHVPGDSASS